jgi:hypothetical protein
VGEAIVPFQASGNINVSGCCADIDSTGIIHLAFGDNSSTDYIYQQFLTDNTLGPSNHFTHAGLGLSGNSFRNLIVFGSGVYIAFPQGGFSHNSFLIGTPLALPVFTQHNPTALDPTGGAGFVNRVGQLLADATTLYYLTSMFDTVTDSQIAFQLFVSSDSGATWAPAPGNDTPNFFYSFWDGGSVQAPHVVVIQGVQTGFMTLVIGGGITKAYGFADAHNSSTGVAQTYILNRQNFGSSPSNLAITGDAPNGQVGVSYGYCYTATGGSGGYVFAILSGSTPPGLTFDPTTGCFTGVPTQTGTFSFVVQVTDSSLNTATVADSITIGGQYVIQLVGYKLYPLASCDPPSQVPEIPSRKSSEVL